jgi:hypothetical protein
LQGGLVYGPEYLLVCHGTTIHRSCLRRKQGHDRGVAGYCRAGFDPVPDKVLR